MRYRKNIKGGKKKIIDQKAILKTVSRGTALFLAAVLFAGSILTGGASAGKTTAVPIMRLQLRSTVKPDR